jgi:hypothetical protein
MSGPRRHRKSPAHSTAVVSDANPARYAAGERARFLAATLVVIGVLTGCSGTVPESPSATAWADDCDQQASTVASALATSTQVLHLVRRDRLPSRYARVVMVQAEESADRAVTSAGALQPPGPARAEDAPVMRALEDAVAAVRETRIALVVEAEPAPGLIAHLRADLRRQHRVITRVVLPVCASARGESR